MKIAPSILSADFSKLGEEITKISEAKADYVHVDVMDGHYVPNITIGPVVVKAIRPYTKLPFDVHLMISNPSEYVEAFAKAGADIITVHAEADDHLDRLLQKIKDLGKKAGVSLNPSTPESVLQYVLDKVDLILVMTVNPGFGGQSFLPGQLQKIAKIKDMIARAGLPHPIDLEVDGGINEKTVALCKKAGANVFVAGNYVFSHKEGYAKAIRSLKEA